MKRAFLLVAGVFLFLGGVGNARENYVADEVLVKFTSGVESIRAQELNSGMGCTIVKKIAKINVFRLRIPPSATVADMIAAYMEKADVEYAEPNYFVHALSVTPDDPYYGLQWHLPKMKAGNAWGETKGSRNVTVAVLDTGVDLTHSDLDEQVVGGYDFVNNDGQPDDDNGHGTHVAGTIAAETNNGEGVAGINWYAKIMPVKVLDEAGEGTHEAVALGLIFAADNGARVINLSFGGEDSSAVMSEAINYAYGKGCVLVAGTGNSGAGEVIFPARHENVVAVGASDEEDNWCNASIWGEGFGSNYGPGIDVVAPGNNIISTYFGGSYAVGSGSSMATACVSGLAALIISANPRLTNSTIRDIITGTADDLMEPGWDEYTGYGRINLQKAIQERQIRPGVPRPRYWPFSRIGRSWWHSIG
jgi:subtilisin family serine protease